VEYSLALSKAWESLRKASKEKSHAVAFVSDTYTVDPEKELILSLACNSPARQYTAILILHYLLRKFKGIPVLTGKWISFKELAGGQGYYPTFKKRVIGQIVKKYGAKPEALLRPAGGLKVKKAELADVSVVLEAFEGVPVLITFWRGDDEFGPEANVLFDESIAGIFCTEDIVVLSETIAHAL